MKIQNKILIFIVTLLLGGNAFAAKILISKTVDHPALDATTQGIIDALTEEKYTNIRVESAQGSAALASQIASKFVSQSPDVVVAVGTMVAQSFVKYATDGKIKMIFSTVTDPLGAGLMKSVEAKSKERPDNNISGVSNFVPLEPQLGLFKQVQPNLKTIGIIYNPGELNSVSIVQKLEILCHKLGLVLLKQTMSKTADAGQSATRLAANVDAIFISNDNTALSALQTIIAAASRTKIPVYISDTDAVKLGAVLALGPNQYTVGLQTGKMIARILKGADINNIPVEFPDKTDLVINLDAAKKAGIEIPEAVMKQASRIEK